MKNISFANHNASVFGEQIYGGSLDAVHGVEHVFDRAAARRACHTAHIERDHKISTHFDLFKKI